MTLKQFCDGENIDIDVAIEKFKKAGFEANDGDNLKALADKYLKNLMQ